ncbi:MAG: hypothetical protein L6277_10250 [Desulfobacterales bacterium]|nr:hypothetical protein [Pseudomonadota bacterium]MBU4357192.1 hypothetical protein [Pseudomonadota bacterium]MCG2772454.1 hypothetical protein [Desulfobacterales bacterium]
MRQEIHQSAIMGCRQSGAMLMAGLAVLFMVIMAAAPAPLQAANQVAELMVSDHADAKGVVEQHQSKFSSSVAEIYGTALISGAKKGKEVTTELFYVTQNLNVLSSRDDLPDDGEVTLTFAFPKPDKGWPAGDYKLVISIAGGATKAVTFQVK